MINLETENTLIIKSMMSMGLTDMESRIYIFLLSEYPTTGYKIAKALQKPVANIYKSLSTLESKGIVLVEEDSKKMYRPIKLDEFLSLIEKRFNKQKEVLKTELSKIEKVNYDEKVYQIKSVPQVYEKVRGMLKKAKNIVLLDMFPLILSEFIDDISTLAKQKKKIIIKAYNPISIPNVEVILDSRGASVLDDYPGEWIKVSIDGSEHLTGLLSKGCKDVHQAIWSSSSFLSIINHFGMKSEMDLDRIGNYINKNNNPEIKKLLSFYSGHTKYDLPGYVELLNKFSTNNKTKNGVNK